MLKDEDGRRADFGLFRDLLSICLVEYHGIKPWREERPKKVNIQGSPLPSSGAMHPNRDKVRQKTPRGLHG